MAHKKLTSCFLLVFAVLFWNFGPSLHHASLFGLHVLGHDLTGGCCCCSHRLPVDSDRHTEVVIDEDGHCSLCDFFDQLNLAIDDQLEVVAVEWKTKASVPHQVAFLEVHVSPQARGPPAVQVAAHSTVPV